MTTPTTEAGRALLAAFSINERGWDGGGWTTIGHVLREDPVPAVLAIEAEAAQAERERLRERAESLVDVDAEGHFRIDWLLADPEPRP